jgi:NUMOD4 motif
MAKITTVESWKTLKTPEGVLQTNKVQISNMGRIRTYNALNDGKIINGSITQGYKILRMRYYTPRTPKIQKEFDAQKNIITDNEFLLKNLSATISSIKKSSPEFKATKNKIEELSSLIKNLKTTLSLKHKTELNSRCIHKHGLVHRLVAENFIKKENKKQAFVIHLNHKKTDNVFTNLKWASSEEVAKHVAKNPAVRKAKADKVYVRNLKNKAMKLNPTKVASIKKLLNEKIASSIIAKKYKVSDMTIHRIKTGINWGDVKAAK